MRPWKSLALAIGALIAVTATLTPLLRDSRGVRFLPEPRPKESGRFDRRQSAGLFIGVRKFRHGETLEVPYAADDAVDLAYAFAFDPRVSLVLPEHVVIALSGRPQKPESRRRLAELEEAGAKIEDAEPSDILALLQRQSALAGKDGILIVSLATHGFLSQGIPYVLGSSSLYPYPETALPMPRLFDIAALSDARRSLFFIDACRGRITKGARGEASPATAAPLIGRMGRVEGQVVFAAAAAGGYSYDGAGNGVFTKAVLDGLDCKAALTRGVVTVETLRTFVERSVRTWIRQHHDPAIRAATQVMMDGDSKNMPLAVCQGPPPPPPPGNVASATKRESVVTAYSANGDELWSRTMSSPISHVDVADLDADSSREVIVGASALVVLDRFGNPKWSVREGTALRAFLVDDLLRRDPTLQIVALWDDDRRSTSRVSIYNAKGDVLSTYDHPGRIEHIAIDRPTSHYGRKIILTGTTPTDDPALGTQKTVASIALLDTRARPLWTAALLPPTERISQLEVIDYDNDARRDIALTTETGQTVYLGFEGKVLTDSSTKVQLNMMPPGKRGS